MGLITVGLGSCGCGEGNQEQTEKTREKPAGNGSRKPGANHGFLLFRVGV
jgi:hypothetical protein